jgi:EAL domain-containing protein (putative c-di-GMP-specific phosphodiesterase class I)
MEASIGIAVFPDHGRDGETLHRHADVAMYAAKHAGLRAQVYDPAHNIYTPQRLALIEDLRSAIREGTLALYFQPQVHMRSGEVVGAEALARWRHPTRGFVPPDEFVRIAEQTGQIAALTAWVLECAMQQAARWSGSLGRAVRISVNISAAQLRDILLCDHIAALLALYGVEACQLRLEVTESALMVDPELSRATVARLASMGIGISVDDYGTCYSSLAYLKRLAVDELKIDRVFVREVGTDRTDAVIVASTVELAHELGLRVVAEGVEDARTWAAVAELGCDVAQGYFLSRPLPADEMERWLRAAGARQHPEGDGALFAHPQWHEA